MVGRVEDKLRPTGDGAVLSDDQPVMVALRIVVQHVVPLEIPGVVDKIVIDGVRPHLYGRICDHVLQVHGAVSLRAGIYFPFGYHRLSFILQKLLPAGRSPSGGIEALPHSAAHPRQLLPYGV